MTDHRLTRPLLVPNRYGTMGFPEDFNRDKEYEFIRAGDDTPRRFALSEQSPYFNVYGLSFRDVTEAAVDHQPDGGSSSYSDKLDDDIPF